MPSSAFQSPPLSTPFPYTTLFRSLLLGDVAGGIRGREQLFQRAALARDLDQPDRDADVEDLVLPHEAVLAHRAGEVISDLPCLVERDRKSTRLNSSHVSISYAVFCFPVSSSLHSLSLHDALPISASWRRSRRYPRPRAALPACRSRARSRPARPRRRC